jgi:hypothetical protein
MPMCWVSLTTDICLVCSVINPHKQFQPLPPPPLTLPPFAAWDLETVFCMFWPPGVATSKNKFTSNVKHKNLCITKEGHDMGPLLIHAPIPGLPGDILFLVCTLKSARKTNFAAGMVQADGDPIACAWFPLFPMTGCAEPVNLPTATPITCALNTVIVNMHWIDVLAGWVQIAADIVVELIKARMPGPAGADPTGIGDALLGAVVGDSFDPRKWAADQIAGNAGNLVRLAGRAFCDDYHGPAAVAVGYNQGMLGGGQVELKFTDDGWSVTGSGTGAGGLVGGSAGVNVPNTGSTTITRSVTRGGVSTSWNGNDPPSTTNNWL